MSKTTINKKGQLFLIAALIIVIIVLSLATTYVYVNKHDAFKNEKYLAGVFEYESAQVVNNAVYNNQDPSINLEKYIETFKNESIDNGVNWTDIQVSYGNYLYHADSTLINLSNSNPHVLYFRLTEIKNGETFVVTQNDV